MATQSELETLAAWLEQQSFAHPKRRDVTMSYLLLVFGSCTVEQLKRVCQTLLSERRRGETRWHPLAIRQKAGINP